jgi:dienelactone hydrolase
MTELVGDLRLPESSDELPAVLLLNQAAGDRRDYRYLAEELGRRGIASLRIDLRGHGESTNLGRFVPTEADEQVRETMIWNAEVDVVAAHEFLRSHAKLDPQRIGIVGASYSGEEMAEAAQAIGYADAYVALSPGSFSDESIQAMDDSGVPWLFVVSRQDRFLHEIAAVVQSTTENVETLYLPGSQHATEILVDRPDIAERIAVWLAAQL